MLAVQDLCFAYRKGGDELFTGLSHTFTPGSITAVTGASGRGKSTLLYLLGLMLRPTRGNVLLAGQVLSDLADTQRSWARAATIGFIFQDAVLDPTRPIVDSVIEPALYAGWAGPRARSRALELLEKVSVAYRAGDRPGEISGGQAQRVAIARALVNDPAVVLADEPTGNLDRDNAAAVLDVLRSTLSAQRTVVIVTHDPFVVDYADEQLTL